MFVCLFGVFKSPESLTDRWSIARCGRPSSSVNIFFSRTTGPILTKFCMNIYWVRRQKIVNFMTPIPRGGNFGVKSVKLMYFLEKKNFYSGARFKGTGRIYQIVNFMTPGQGLLCRGVAICQIVKMHYFFKNLHCLLPGIEQTN